jgi:hypothetical protein
VLHSAAMKVWRSSIACAHIVQSTVGVAGPGSFDILPMLALQQGWRFAAPKAPVELENNCEGTD